MPNQLIDRWNLRRLKRSLYKRRFENQNNDIGNYLDIHPSWLHISRLNYQYIFSKPSSFWPDWAIEQFHPTNTNATVPMNDLLCLNYSHRDTFCFSNGQNTLFEVNSNGFISLPKHGWGVCIKYIKDNVATPFYTSPLTLSSKYPIIEYQNTTDQLSISSSIAFDPVSNIGEICLTFTNNTTDQALIPISIGIIPYINEGVGAIKHIQYISNNSFYINDSSSVTFSESPQNVLCTNFSHGNIFERSQEWEMILNAKCPDYLASGLANYQIELEPNNLVHTNIY